MAVAAGGGERQTLGVAPSRRSLQRLAQKYALNPGVRLIIRAGYAPRMFALIETTGRRTGLPRQTPVTVAAEGTVVWLVAEHGVRSDYVRNISASQQVRLKMGRRWHTGRAALMSRDDPWARRKEMDRLNGWLSRADSFFFQMMASSPLTVRIDLDD